ncbi:hypothetical protein ANN_16069 [Periplaneta americana]|uniref:Endonuclease-reverse transcriptase n=1 Tax=Periplaneta americana TaxID=6978 RepID=A0ABQ8SJ62_PERAM|nr:hypothetical protein ANN_16069 [Periplaneta americana]
MPLQSDAREIVYNVHTFFVEEYDALKVGNPTISVVEVAKQTAAACGVSERTVYRILNEKREADESGRKVSTPGKKRPQRTPTKTNIDSFTAAAIKRQIYSLYKTDFIPSVEDIRDALHKSGLFSGSKWSNILRNGTIKVGDLSFEEVEKFTYLGATVTNVNDTREEIKRRINMGNACYYSVEKLLSSNLLSKNLKVRIYKTVILPVVLYGCETWTLTLREEQRLRVFENKILRKIFGAKRDEVTGEWRKLHNAELHALYPSPDIIRNIKSRRLRWAGHVARMGESRNPYRVLAGRPEGKRPLGRPRRRWEDNIKMDLREVGYDGRDWINLAQDRDQWRAYVRVVMNLRVL